MTDNEKLVAQAEALIGQYEKESASSSNVAYDARNYLNVRLGPSEKSKRLVIRVLPFEPESTEIFHKVYMHQVKVNKEVSPSGWKNFVCPTNNGLGDSCPFCYTSERGRETKNKVTTVADRKMWGDIEYMNKVREMFVIRCIERGHEEDGVKFWMFNSAKRHDGPFDKMYNIFKQRWDSAKEKGKVSNIFDINEGKDLIISVTKSDDGKSIIQITDDDEKSPLSTDKEKMELWINDEKKWTDVYKVKPVEYMEIIIENGIPVYDKDAKKFVDRNNANNQQQEPEKTQEEFEMEAVDKSGIDITKKPVEEKSLFQDEEEQEDLPF